MKIPDKIKINGVEYGIEFVEAVEDDIHEVEFTGRVLFRENKIKISNSYKTDSKFRTLLHEIIHILDYDYKMELPEETIRRLASGLYGTLKDNNLLKE